MSVHHMTKGKQMPSYMSIDDVRGEERVDTCDLIELIESITDEDRGEPVTDEEREFLAECAAIEGYAADWLYGEQVILASDFVNYTEELIDGCYTMPEGFDSGQWPWRHITFDYQAAAAELEADYAEVKLLGHDYMVRS